MKNEILKDKILLNSGRNCLKYTLRTYEIEQINLPYYICPVVRQAINEENVKMKFYHIDKNFLPTEDFAENEYILYPNYFGLCNRQAEYLTKKYKNLINDNAHAFFAPKNGIASFSSPRKFFNVNDGGILDIDKKLDEFFEQDLDRNIVITDFDSFCKNEISIDNEPIKIMSQKTQNLLKNVDFEQKMQKNRQFFAKIDQKLKKNNILNFEISNEEVPMCYPFLSKNFNDTEKLANKLENAGIYLIKYGTNLPKSYPEYDFTKILMIPLTEKNAKFFDKFYDNDFDKLC